MIKFYKLLLGIVPLLFIVIACNQTDDICLSGGTPRMKVKFKDEATGKLLTRDTLYVSVIYNNDTLKVTRNDSLQVDSIMVPLQVSGALYTDILVKKTLRGKYNKIRVNYNETSEYVSPGCGIRKIYDDISPEILEGTGVKKVEINANKIHDENRTVLYFNF